MATEIKQLTKEQGQDLQAQHTNTLIEFMLWLVGLSFDKALKKCFHVWITSDSAKNGIRFAEYMKTFCDKCQDQYEATQQIPRSFSLGQRVVDEYYGSCVPIVMQDNAKFIMGLATSSNAAHNQFKRATKDRPKREIIADFIK